MAIGLVLHQGVSGSPTRRSCCSKAPLYFRRKYKNSSIRFGRMYPSFGDNSSLWIAGGQENSSLKVEATADHSDAAPDASEYLVNQGYHPLEELKDHERNHKMMLTDAEIARTTVEMHNNAYLIFPGPVHCEPHRHVSWGEFHYIVDDYGDIFFEIFDEENLLQDFGASNPVTVLIGMDGPFYGELGSLTDSYKDNSSRSDHSSKVHCEVMEISDILSSWGMPDTLRQVHPLHFARCLSKAAHTKYGERMEYPSNGICMTGCLRPTYIDEQSYLRGLFYGEENNGYESDWRDESEKEEEQVAAAYDLIDDEFLSFNINRKGSMRSSVYKLEIMTIKLFSVYGDQSKITLQDFQDAEPDALAHCASTIIERFSVHGMSCSSALKALCRRKGLNIEGATLIGVDSLGMDVRVFSGKEAWTVRFSFNSRVASETAAEKKIRRMLFPHYRRKSAKFPADDTGDSSAC